MAISMGGNFSFGSRGFRSCVGSFTDARSRKTESRDDHAHDLAPLRTKQKFARSAWLGAERLAQDTPKAQTARHDILASSLPGKSSGNGNRRRFRGLTMNILVIEDDAAVRDSIELMLKVHGWNIFGTALGQEGLDLASQSAFDLVLLDLNLPDINGMEVLKALRKANIATPLMVMSGYADSAVKVTALRAGADDCIAKPFHKDELLARIRAVTRRGKAMVRSVIELGEVLIDLDSKTVEAAGVRVGLTIKEYEILELLLLRRGSTLSKGALIEHLYNGMDEPEQKIIDVFVCKLRKKLSAATHGVNHIKTVWGLGYCWDDAGEKIAA